MLLEHRRPFGVPTIFCHAAAAVVVVVLSDS